MIQIFKATIWFLCIHETNVGVILHEGLFLNSPAVLQTMILHCMNAHIQVPPTDNQEKYFYYSSAPLFHKLKL